MKSMTVILKCAAVMVVHGNASVTDMFSSIRCVNRVWKTVF